MSRLFTFGCSFTQYQWPTWANIVALDQEKELYNFGLAGLGNVGINQRILEADCKFNFQPNDEIMIMWTSWCREDKIAEFDYTCGGSIFNKPASIKWFRENWSYIDTIVKNSNAVIYSNLAYKQNISWQGNAFDNDFIESGTMPSVNLIKNIDFAKQIKQLYEKKLPKISNINFVESGNKSFGVLHDSHPDVIDHMNITLDSICTLKQETKDLCVQLQNAITSELIKKQILSNTYELVMEIIQQDFKNSFARYFSHKQFKDF